MQLSEKTMTILQNFATINPNILFNGSELVKTMAEGRNIVAKATIDTYPDQEVGVYDLNEFMSTLELVDQPEVKFNKDHMLVSDQSGRSRVKYFYSSPDVLTYPSKDITMPSSEVNFVLDASTLSKILKAASALKHEDLRIEPKDGALRLSVVSTGNVSSNSFSIDVAGKFDSEKFALIFRIANLRLIKGDYEVSLSKKLISHFKHTSEPIEYWIALEKDSEYS